MMRYRLTAKIRSKAFWFWVLAFAVITLYSQIPLLLSDPSLNRYTPPFVESIKQADPFHLGAEYINVATSLYQNHEFANPFYGETGSTAWVSPVIPTAFAILLWIFDGSRLGVAIVLYAIQTLILASIAARVTRFASAFGFASAGILAVACILVTDFQFAFQMTHDSLLIACFIAWQCIFWVNGNLDNEIMRERPWKSIFGWGLLGGVSALMSPIAGLSWLSITAITGRSLNAKRLAVTGVICILVVTPWCLRNYMVFGKLIPGKSNAGYELYQSLADEKNGIVTFQSMQTHPYNPNTIHGKRYREIGEIAFAEEKLSEAKELISGGPALYLQLVANRLQAATIAFPILDDLWRVTWYYKLSASLYPLAFLGFLWSMFAIKYNDNRLVRSCQVVYVAYLLPYVVTSFYLRYAVPLLFVRAIFVAIILIEVFSLVGSTFRFLKR